MGGNSLEGDMTFGERVKTWIVDHPFHIARYIGFLVFLGLAVTRMANMYGSEAGAAMGILGFLFFLILALACILPDIIKLVTGFLSYIITKSVYPDSKEEKMSNDPRLADYYLENERYEESLHEFERLHDDYPEDYHVLSQIVKLQEILGDEKMQEKYAEKLSKLPEPEVVENSEDEKAGEEGESLDPEVSEEEGLDETIAPFTQEN